MDKNELIIAAIVSDEMRHCVGFLKHYNLNPIHFLKIDSVDKLQGLDTKIAIILTYGFGKEYNKIVEFAKSRFKSVRYIDY